MNIDLTKTQQYLDWLKEKLYLNQIAPTAKDRVVHRGQVYQCKLGIGIGSEECKERPCVILQHNPANKTSSNTIVAPISHSASSLPVVVPISDKSDSKGNIILNGNVLLGNVTCISKARLGNYITRLTKEEMFEVDKALAISLGIYHHYHSLQNICNDKATYIEKLQKLINLQQTELNNVRQQVEELQLALNKFLSESQ